MDIKKIIDRAIAIKKLDETAVKLRSVHKAEAALLARALVDCYGIRPDEVGVKVSGAQAAASSGAETAEVSAVQPGTQGREKRIARYRSPDGKLWSGAGRMPKTMSELIKSGQNKKEDFAIEPVEM